MEETHWVCQVCKKPMATEGIIEVINVNIDLGPIGTYPMKATEDEAVVDARRRAERAAQLGISEEELSFQPFQGSEGLRLEKNVDFTARHLKCYADSEMQGYWFASREVETLEEWVKKLIHLGEKTWIGREDVLGGLEFWWTHKGKNPYDPTQGA